MTVRQSNNTLTKHTNRTGTHTEQERSVSAFCGLFLIGAMQIGQSPSSRSDTCGVCVCE